MDDTQLEAGSSIMEAMRINPGQIAEGIVNYLCQKVSSGNHDGICMGISGGVDSSSLAYLAVKAMRSPKQVFGFYMFDRYSQQKYSRFAQKIVNQLGINFQSINITEALQTLKIYESPILRLSNYSAKINQFLFPKFLRIRNYIRAKRVSEISYSNHDSTDFTEKDKENKSHSLSPLSLDPIFNGFRVRHILRRKILEDFSLKNNLLLVGAANRSEAFIGWYVAGGIDDLPIEPLMGLYKNQIKQLASYLGVPREILNERPSPDMLKGVGDEDLLGYSYETIDKVAYAMEHGLSKETLIKEGIHYKDINMIMLLHRTALKRRKLHDHPTFE